MPGPKELRTPEQYQRWLDRHRVVEKQRVWKKKLEENPIKALPIEERGPLPMTFSAQEAFWHKIGCVCGSCLGPLAKSMKDFRMSMNPIPPAVTALVSHLPELPYPAQLHLQAFAEAARSKED